MNCLDEGKRPIAFTKVNAYAGIIEPLDEAKKMKHCGVRSAPLWLIRRDHRTAITDYRRTYFVFAPDARLTFSPLQRVM
jgi:hypothetical protein